MCKSRNQGIDECIKPIVDALNKNGVKTIASCCGHGFRNGIISLKDGRQLSIFPNHKSWKEFDKTQLTDINGQIRDLNPDD